MRFIGPTIRFLLQQSTGGTTAKAASRPSVNVNRSTLNAVTPKEVITETSRAKVFHDAGILKKAGSPRVETGTRSRITPLCSSQWLAATVRAEQLTSRPFSGGSCYTPSRSFSTHSLSSRLSSLLNNQLRISPKPQPNPVHYIFKRDANTTSLRQMHRRGPVKKFRPPRKPLDGRPMMKGVVLKPVIKKPKKPNSANRKCVLVRLANGKEKVAYVPGIGHNLQEHNVVLVRCGRLQDVPGVKLKCIRGKHDLPHVIKQSPNK